MKPSIALLICALLVANLANAQSRPLSESGNDEWVEISAGNQTKGSVNPNGSAGDRMWIPGPGETFADIAFLTTGSREHADAIARYNDMHLEQKLDSDRLLFIPEYLLLPPQNKSQSVNWEIKEFGESGSGGIERSAVERNSLSTLAKPAKSQSTGTSHSRLASTINVDMFAGEVKVLGKVNVTRVAIGNGSIVRAEVLKNGELLVIAQTAGSTSLRLWHKDEAQSDFNIRVSEKDPVTRIRMEKMVQMKVRMIEFRKSSLGKLGIDWSDSIAGPTFAAAGDAIGNNLFRPVAEGFSGLPNTVSPFSTYFGIASNITSRINLLASSGDAVTLAEPVLSCASGGSASFLAGGEVPYPTVGANGQTTVQFKEYGIKLNVSPSIDDAGNVRTTVETEISQLDPAVSVQGAPGLLTRRAQTQVNVRSGQTIVISGLLSSENSKDVDKIPGIGNLPIIGNFFKSQSSRNAASELVIFLTPEVIDPAKSVMSENDQEILFESQERISRARQSLPLME